ncbi:MAG: lytic transglycosylase domain-containing protein [Deltaproteobacteria bacterium]|jgi:soluble lytic murein transglycosylase-like protein|nr:lytic transglycosylase domain-containing protein [Deltaproteobacteria bacterium]MDH3775181.1 lytic transglycosylase domain-containing protein [Deltaproteobacteria bacterium]MDH3803090.1 lytic transglycosylase domain-containing protein [Deltaproteobacteria bacterium]MDH3852255.1 lytic transglycosylase domain-containing protein [Deltaproteobacteria bacterium]MDH3897874.1 lytic transglycosylase domain-containing protein [Deltaproteobacteria bacterium]
MANYMDWLFRRAVLPWLLLLVLLGAIVKPALADIYRYVDEDGVIHFSNVPTHYRFRLYISETKLDYRAYFDRYDRIITRAARKHGVDNTLVKAVIRAESDFDRNAVSNKGAQGLMQLMPETAKDLAVKDSFDPHENINAGVRYLKRQLNNFENNVPLALAAYNAGENAVRRYGRIPPYKETRTFVDRVLRYWDEFSLNKQSKP